PARSGEMNSPPRAAVAGSGASGAPPAPPARSAGVNPAPLAAVAGSGASGALPAPLAAEACGIRFGLAAIKNVGEGAVEAVLTARRQGGRFTALFDFCERVDLRAVNGRVVESFIKSGSFDSLAPRRASLFSAIDYAMDAGQKLQRDREQGQSSLLGMLVGPESHAAGGPDS